MASGLDTTQAHSKEAAAGHDDRAHILAGIFDKVPMGDHRATSSPTAGDSTRVSEKATVGAFNPKEPYTKEPYSPSVSAAAFQALKRDTGVDLTGADKWEPKTREQKWWTKSMQDAAANSTDIPSGVEIKAKASVGNPDPVNKEVGSQLQSDGRKNSLYLAGSINVLEPWNAKEKMMPVKGADGKLVKDETGHEKYFPSVYKEGTVYNVDGSQVFETHHNQSTGLRTFAIPNPGSLPAGMDVNNYAQQMVTKALTSKGENGPIEFPMYDKTVDQKLDGLTHMKTKDGQYEIADAKMTGIFQANAQGQRSYERQEFRLKARGIRLDNDPPATRLDKPFMVVQVSQKGRAFMIGDINVADMKKPVIEGINK